MTTPPVKINSITVIAHTNNGSYEVVLSEDSKYRIFKRELDVRKITLVDRDLSEIFANLKK